MYKVSRAVKDWIREQGLTPSKRRAQDPPAWSIDVIVLISWHAGPKVNMAAQNQTVSIRKCDGRYFASCACKKQRSGHSCLDFKIKAWHNGITTRIICFLMAQDRRKLSDGQVAASQVDGWIPSDVTSNALMSAPKVYSDCFLRLLLIIIHIISVA